MKADRIVAAPDRAVLLQAARSTVVKPYERERLADPIMKVLAPIRCPTSTASMFRRAGGAHAQQRSGRLGCN